MPKILLFAAILGALIWGSWSKWGSASTPEPKFRDVTYQYEKVCLNGYLYYYGSWSNGIVMVPTVPGIHPDRCPE